MSGPRVIVAGSQTFTDYALLERVLDAMPLFTRSPVVISGGAIGADKLGERYARERGLSVILVPVYDYLWKKYGKPAGPRRNALMADLATHVVVFWNGRSPGSRSMIEIARARRLPLRVIEYREVSER